MNVFIYVLIFIGILGTILSIVLEKERKPKYDYQTQLNFLNDSLYVKKVINSCKTWKQLLNADNLARHFREKYRCKVEISLYNKVCKDLDLYWIAKKDKIFDESKN